MLRQRMTGLTLAAGLLGCSILAAPVTAQIASPKFANQPAGDLSTPPGARAKWFYAPADSDPAVIAEDDATESVLTPGELASFPLPVELPETNQINVPVLLAQGQDDI
jgi:hypothetical protein